MVAEMIKFSQHYQGKVAFIWTASRDVLTSQQKKFKYISVIHLNVQIFDLKENKISPSEILFINWEKINSKIIEENNEILFK